MYVYILCLKFWTVEFDERTLKGSKKDEARVQYILHYRVTKDGNSIFIFYFF